MSHLLFALIVASFTPDGHDPAYREANNNAAPKSRAALPASCTRFGTPAFMGSVPELDRRRLMLTTGVGLLAAAIPVAEAKAAPDRVAPPEAPAGSAPTPNYLF